MLSRQPILNWTWASLVSHMVKNGPAVQETQVWPLGGEDSHEEGNGYQKKKKN